MINDNVLKTTSNYIYFFYDSNNILLYIGKTTNLINRLRCHFSKDNLISEPWKQLVDRDKITYYQCITRTDLDVYETYFINEYNPKHNMDKVFHDNLSFNLPYLEPISLKRQYEIAQGVIDCFNANYDNEMITNGLFEVADPNLLYRSKDKLTLTTF